ncbi:MBL fold metallo-hydrolase [Stenotrophomonas maltophilia]|uniref:ComEC/Rec2 family competence protein n=1 Tax=Stenotrophomonas maltophilia TaxID=40324 RepID=UPI001094AC84|nr:MBL fold metallo-hydrolase [Stenotrophomonas maltophilia]TGW15929.1 MBL fold metallo-hydrolase [Stenotrophomonas maltophilia]
MSRVGCYVLDVGQGNAALIEGDSGAVLVDAGPGKTAVLKFLEDHSINRLSAVFISHADKDHLGGLLAILAKADTDESFKIDHIYVNPDSRDSDVWEDIAYQLRAMEKRKVTSYSPQLGPDTFENSLDLGGCSINVLGPSKYMRLRAIGGKYKGRRKQSANSLSAVIHVSFQGRGWVLLPGDLDHLGFSDAAENATWQPAPVLVFPHHGGRAGSDDQTRNLAHDIVEASSSRWIVFSGRSRTSKFPSPLVVDTLLGLGSIPNLLCIGASPVLAERIAQLDPCPHRNGTGTLLVLPPVDGIVEVIDYQSPPQRQLMN